LDTPWYLSICLIVPDQQVSALTSCPFFFSFHELFSWFHLFLFCSQLWPKTAAKVWVKEVAIMAIVTVNYSQSGRINSWKSFTRVAASGSIGSSKATSPFNVFSWFCTCDLTFRPKEKKKSMWQNRDIPFAAKRVT
jgi:hypothetical protein